ncbi:MAG: DNA repair protein RecN [Clostridia bacterium]|nr:DNA repair protein RecN [Clostridia bacterium]
MLHNLKIENVAIIESADIVFENGLNIMTGETGAGKSIIIDSINAVLGERTSRELVRTGCNKASVSAVFKVENKRVSSVLDDLGIEQESDGMLLISRSISTDGKNICRVNGMPVTVGMLKTLGRELINIHGQHDSQRLLDPESQYVFIDELAGNVGLLAEYRSKYNELVAVRRKISSLVTDDEEKNRRIELLSYQINEIENAQLTIGEMDELRSTKVFYRNLEKIISAVNEAYMYLSGGDEAAGALQAVKMAAARLDTVSEFSKSIAENGRLMHDVSYQLEDMEDRLRSVLDELEYDPEYISQVEARLDYLNKLSRKYGADEEAMLAFCDKCKQEKSEIEFSDATLDELKSSEKELFEQVKSFAAELTACRKKTSIDFSEKVCSELSFLDMPGVLFEVLVNEVELNENGADSIEFLISPNAGENPKPLAKIASGGELSRIMLAIKNVLSDKDGIETLIFDEIDTGVSGRAAVKLGKKLKEVSKGRQVLCVTHLAQIACQADNHFEISKSSHDGKTFTTVTPLDRDGRIYELARIIGGENVTQTQLDMAEEMLTKI